MPENAFQFTHWPTDYPVVTQPYNNDPGYYGQWGLTGHEGIDIQAPRGSAIYAVAPGKVVRIVAESEGRAYGNAVYIEHDGGYRTAYAHLQDVHVRRGDTVSGGQQIGRAGDTGNSQGPHLHLTLYLEGASEQGLTPQPRDIVDPTPFLEPLLHAGWEAPSPPLVSGWGWADSIQQRNGLGRVTNAGGINVREQPAQSADKLGLLPQGAVVRLTGAQRNNYYPFEVAAVDLGEREPGATAAETAELAYTFVSFHSTAGDYTNMQPGRQFTAKWTVRNSGDQPWTGDYRLSYVEATRPETENHAPSRMGAKATYTLRQLTGRGEVNPGEALAIPLTLVAPRQAGWFASNWQLQTPRGEPIGRPLWLRLNVRGAARPRPAPRAEQGFQPGMNVNPDAHGLALEHLRGLHWVRWVYKAAAKHRNVDEAFQAQYRGLIQSYAGAGIKSLIVLNQETAWANAPWDNGGWDAYAGALGSAARRIAELCAPFGEMVAYQIWNEEDSPPTNPSAIGVPAEDLAPVVDRVAQAIRAVDPKATIVLGGLNSGPENAVAYVRRLRQSLNGRLPVDALAYHPYGRYVHNDPFYDKHFGTLQHALDTFRQAFPDLPLWITEMGVADNNPIGPEHYEKIARYMREIVAEIANNRTEHTPVLIWFAWSDLMRNAGITTVGGQIKPHIGDAYRDFVARGAPDEGAKAVGLLGTADSEFLRFTTTLEDYNAVPAGSTFTNRWYYENSGGTTWGDGYRLVHTPEGADSAPLAGETAFDLASVASPFPAEPGEEVVIELTMRAPEQFGRHYQSRWELRDPSGRPFGHLYAEITVAPASSVGTGAQHAEMAFVADHTVPDDSRFPEGETFLKQWRVRNTGPRKWGKGFRLVFVEGDLAMARGIPSHIVPEAARGDEVILSVPMVAPLAGNDPTSFQSLWRLQDDRGDFFGTAIWARILSLPAGAAAALGRFADPSSWYSQLDPRWKNDLLGHGRQTIGDWGCLMTCYAMMLSAYGRRTDPARLNEQLREIGDDGFRGSNVQFVAPTRLLPGLHKGKNIRSWPDADVDWTEWTAENPIQRIDRALAAGHVVLAQVDRAPNNAYYHSNTEQHWVILVSRTEDGGDYLILDPITPPDRLRNQPVSLMRKYGSRAPSRPHEENLRNAIISALVYRYSG